MKTKTIITAVIVIALVVCGFLFARSCGVDARLAKAKADYEESRRAWAADQEIMSTRLDELNKAIGRRDESIGQLEQEVAQYVEKLRHTTQELEELQNAEPPTTPEVEALPIVINLRGQIAKLAETFTLSQQTIAAQSQEITELKEKCELLTQVGDEWKGAYERERALRVQCEGLFKISEQRLRLSKTVTKVVIIAGAVVVGSQLLK